MVFFKFIMKGGGKKRWSDRMRMWGLVHGRWAQGLNDFTAS